VTSHACIVRKSDNKVLARAATVDQAIQLEGNWYFHTDAVDHSLFELSDRTYTCPDKGTCFWIDLKTNRGYINDVAWVYPETEPEYRKIAGWYGFYADHRIYAFSECDETE